MHKAKKGHFYFFIKVECPFSFCYVLNQGSTQPVSVRTRKNLDISVTVVRIGPEARAGACSNPRSTSGTVAPKHTATSVFTASSRMDVPPSASPLVRFPAPRCDPRP